MSDMDPPPMILPKGIVFNIDRVYKEVANYTTVPPEKIYEYWHGNLGPSLSLARTVKLTYTQSILRRLAGSRILLPTGLRISGGMSWAVTDVRSPDQPLLGFLSKYQMGLRLCH